MNTKILLIDTVEKHRTTLKNFLRKAQPDIELVAIDHSNLVNSGPIDWNQYFLLIIDNQLGDQNGVDWVRQHRDDNKFPAFIFLSSAIDPDSLESSIQSDEALKLGAEAYLYKKNLNSAKLNYYISNALEKSGAFKALPGEDRVFGEQGENEDQEQITLSEPESDEDVALDSTFHQMSHAKALLHGYEDWPFDIKDMLAGKAVLDGYIIDTYLGKRDDVFSFAVRKAEDSVPYVLKLIDRSTIQGRPPPEPLISDLDILINTKSDNLVHRHDYKLSNDYLIIIEELLLGKKLSGRLKKTGVTEEQAVDYMLQILAGLNELHHHGLVAGAMSPDNLLFRNEKTLALTHFNNCYYTIEHKENKGIRYNYQQALYESPEKIQGRQSDHRSDLYVAGTIFYHMLAGTPPYHGKTTQDVLTEHVASPIPTLPSKDHPMNNLIARLMMKTPSQRIQSADEAAASIKYSYKI